MRASYFERGIIQKKEMPPRDVGSLTPHRQNILREVASGKTNKEVARSIGLSPDAIKGHLTEIYRHLEVSSRSGATIATLSQNVELPTSDQVKSTSASLSRAETVVMMLVINDDTGGMTVKDIARKAEKSPHTIHNHLTKIYRKLGVSNRVEAIQRFKARMGLTAPLA